jgi:hypothetical protein
MILDATAVSKPGARVDHCMMTQTAAGTQVNIGLDDDPVT